jgi:glucose/arabinose dehydrogenase
MRAARATVVLVIVGALTLATACSDDSRPTPSPTPTPTPPAGDTFTTSDGVRFAVELVATNFEVPWAMAFAPDGRLFVTERPGRVRILDLAARSSQLALTLDDVFTQGEAGLLGLALDPGFATTRLVYLHYTAAAGGSAVNRLVRYREVAGQLGERAVLLDGIPGATIHDGGRLRFGPDGFLYVTAGDAANQNLAQDLASYAGKILRLTRDGTSPPGNAFASPVYTYGHRNPQGLDWHPVSGDLWASEHGPTGNDEINVIESGANYGWPVIQGNASRPDMRTPIAFFDPAIAPSGTSFYRGTPFPGFVNDLFVGTLRGTHLLRLRLDPSAPRRIVSQERLLDGRYGRIRDVISGPDGFLYFATNNRDGRGSPTADDDRIARLVPR